MTLPKTAEPTPPRTREGAVLLRSLAETSMRDAARCIERILSSKEKFVVSDSERTQLEDISALLRHHAGVLSGLCKV